MAESNDPVVQFIDEMIKPYKQLDQILEAIRALRASISIRIPEVFIKAFEEVE